MPRAQPRPSLLVVVGPAFRCVTDSHKILVRPDSAPERFHSAEAEGVSLLRAQTVRGPEVPKRSPLTMTDWAG